MKLDKLMLLLTSLLFLGIVSCSNDEDPDIPPEPELITTLNYTLTSSGGDVVVLSFQDIDGDGGNAPIVMNGTLAANDSYTGSLELLNESVSPAEDITQEIMEEDEEHQFFFQSTVPGLTVAYGDQDEDGNPIGLITNLFTADAGSGSMTIILRHEPNKSGEGVASGDITNASGETDIEVTFTIDVQ